MNESVGNYLELLAGSEFVARPLTTARPMCRPTDGRRSRKATARRLDEQERRWEEGVNTAEQAVDEASAETELKKTQQLLMADPLYNFKPLVNLSSGDEGTPAKKRGRAPANRRAAKKGSTRRREAKKGRPSRGKRQAGKKSKRTARARGVQSLADRVAEKQHNLHHTAKILAGQLAALIETRKKATIASVAKATGLAVALVRKLADPATVNNAATIDTARGRSVLKAVADHLVEHRVRVSDDVWSDLKHNPYPCHLVEAGDAKQDGDDKAEELQEDEADKKLLKWFRAYVGAQPCKASVFAKELNVDMASLRQLLDEQVAVLPADLRDKLKSWLAWRIKVFKAGGDWHTLGAGRVEFDSKSQPWLDYVQEGAWVFLSDPKDGLVYEAQVKRRVASLVLVHYNTFCADWDEWLDLADERITPWTQNVPEHCWKMSDDVKQAREAVEDVLLLGGVSLAAIAKPAGTTVYALLKWLKASTKFSKSPQRTLEAVLREARLFSALHALNYRFVKDGTRIDELLDDLSTEDEEGEEDDGHEAGRDVPTATASEAAPLDWMDADGDESDEMACARVPLLR